MLSYTELAVTTDEANDYLGLAGVEVRLHESDLMVGQRFIASRFNGRWVQQWTDENPMPEAVKWAIIEAAVVAKATPGILSPVQNPNDKVLVQAGKLAWQRVAGPGGADAYIPRIAAVEGLLSGLVRNGSVSFLMRA